MVTGVRGIAVQDRFVDGTKLKIVDSDGANERILPTVGAALSPSWHPSGRYIVYCDADDRGTRIAQFDLRTMRTQLLPASSRGLNITPVYTKDGKNIVWASGAIRRRSHAGQRQGSDSLRCHSWDGADRGRRRRARPEGKQVVFSRRVRHAASFYMNGDGTGYGADAVGDGKAATQGARTVAGR